MSKATEQPIVSREEADASRMEWKKWENLNSTFQYASLAGLFAMMFILEAVGKETAKHIVWYLAVPLSIFCIVGFIIGRISGKKLKAYTSLEQERLEGLSKMLK